MLQSLKKLKLGTKLVTRPYISIHIKIYLQSFVSIIIFIIYKQSSTKVFFTTGPSHWTTGLSATSISNVTFVDKCSWLVYMIYQTYLLLSAFLSSQWSQHLTLFLEFSKSHVLIVLISWYSFPLLNWIIKLSLNWSTVLLMGIVKRCIPENNLLQQQDHTI